MRYITKNLSLKIRGNSGWAIVDGLIQPVKEKTEQVMVIAISPVNIIRCLVELDKPTYRFSFTLLEKFQQPDIVIVKDGYPECLCPACGQNHSNVLRCVGAKGGTHPKNPETQRENALTRWRKQNQN